MPRFWLAAKASRLLPPRVERGEVASSLKESDASDGDGKTRTSAYSKSLSKL